MRTSSRIRGFIEDELLGGREVEGDPLAMDLLDSLAIEQLVGYLENEYAIRFSEEEVVAENFASLRVLATLVRQKRRSPRRR